MAVQVKADPLKLQIYKQKIVEKQRYQMKSRYLKRKSNQ